MGFWIHSLRLKLAPIGPVTANRKICIQTKESFAQAKAKCSNIEVALNRTGHVNWTAEYSKKKKEAEEKKKLLLLFFSP